MRHVMYCISGYSGTGKDEVASRLVTRYKAVQTGLADPAKRHMADLYGFTENQLFGPSSARNGGDTRYPKDTFRKYGCSPYLHHDGIYGKATPLEFVGDEDRYVDLPELQCGPLSLKTRYWTFEGRSVPEAAATGTLPGLPWQPLKMGNSRYFVPEGDPRFWLSPREALQRYCELMNQLYLRSWSRKGVEVHKRLSEIHQEGRGEAFFRYSYSKMDGLVKNDVRDGTNWQPFDGTFRSCFADFRHVHEIVEADSAGTESLTPVLIRVKRPSVPAPPYDHRSETEQAGIPDQAFDYVIENDGTLSELYVKVDKIVEETGNSEWSRLRMVEGVMLS